MAMLSEQYRMDPAISAFPAAFFYDGQLRDHPSVRQRAADGALPDPGYCQPLAFFDCRQASPSEWPCRHSASGLAALQLMVWTLGS